MRSENKRFVIDFGNGNAAYAVQLAGDIKSDEVAEVLGFDRAQPTIFISGGAMEMDSDEMLATRPLIEEGLARFVEEKGVAVIDGGTHAGVMRLMGDARRRQGLRFPLIGVAPLAKISYPGYENPRGMTLDTGHTHFVFTEGEKFGDESKMIAWLTNALSGDGKCPALGIVINGGNVTREEIHRLATSRRLKFPLLIVEGTGRFADNLAAVIRGMSSDDEELHEIAEKGEVQLVSVQDGPEGLRSNLESLFAAHRK